MIAIGCDHGGFKLKAAVKKFLEENGYEYKDFGTDSEKSCDYADFAKEVAYAVKNGECEKGILICGTGIGMSICANKFRGIRAVVASDVFSVRHCRLHNDANILCMGARVMARGLAMDLIEIFLNTEFEGGRHATRVNMFEENID